MANLAVLRESLDLLECGMGWCRAPPRPGVPWMGMGARGGRRPPRLARASAESETRVRAQTRDGGASRTVRAQTREPTSEREQRDAGTHGSRHPGRAGVMRERHVL
eukprot:4087223-Prymnesium_polylepis.1